MSELKNDGSGVVRGLAALKHATMLDEIDRAFVETGGVIHYFIDADIFALIIAPGRERGYAGMFQGDLHAVAAVHPAAYETAEYLLSQRLPGQRADDGKPPLWLSNGHLRDVNNIIGALNRKFEKIHTRRYPKKKGIDHLDALMQYIDAHKLDGVQDHEILDAAEKLRRYSQDALDIEIEAALSLARLTSQATFRPANGLPLYQSAVTSIGVDQIREWCARLAAARESTRFSTVAQGHRIFEGFDAFTRSKIEADARTIAEIEHLNQNQSTGQRYVLLSGAITLHRAYLDYAISRERVGDLRGYGMRHPMQFLPLLNNKAYATIFDSPNAPDRLSTLHSEISEALDYILDPSNARPSPRMVMATFLYSDLHSTGNLDDDRAHRLVFRRLEWSENEYPARELADKWRLAYSNATLLHMGALKVRQRAHEATLSKALAATGDEFVQALQNIVANIELNHIGMTLMGLGVEVQHELSSGTPDIAEQPIRVFLPLLFDTSEMLGASTPSKAFAGSIENVLALIPRFAEQQSAALTFERMLTGVCTALALCSWTHAKRMAVRGIALAHHAPLPPSLTAQGVTTDDIIAEFNYLLALGIRFDCDSDDEFESALEALREPRRIANTDRSHVREIRRLLERATLLLASTLHSLGVAGEARLWPHLQKTRDYGAKDTILGKASDLLLAARDRLAKLHHLNDDIVSAAHALIEKQYRVNVMSAFNLYAAAHLKPPKDLVVAAREALDQITYSDLENASWVVRLNVSAFRLLTNAGDDHDLDTFRHAATKIKKLHSMPATRRIAAASDHDLACALVRVVEEHRLEL